MLESHFPHLYMWKQKFRVAERPWQNCAVNWWPQPIEHCTAEPQAYTSDLQLSFQEWSSWNTCITEFSFWMIISWIKLSTQRLANICTSFFFVLFCFVLLFFFCALKLGSHDSHNIHSCLRDDLRSMQTSCKSLLFFWQCS